MHQTNVYLYMISYPQTHLISLSSLALHTDNALHKIRKSKAAAPNIFKLF
jgi:hypothetical protein